MTRGDELRVLGVVTDTDRRGGQVFGVDLGRQLARRGVESTTVALAPGTQPAGLAVEVLAPSRWRPSGVRRLRRLMASHDVTVAHGSSTLPACAVAGGGRGRAFVYRQISDPLYWGGRGLRRWRVRWYYRHAAHVVPMSAAAARTLTEHFGVRPDDMTVIPNAVDHERFEPPSAARRTEARAALGIPDDRPVVAFLGALAPEKGVDDLVAAVDRSWHLLVAGDGPLRTDLERAASRRGIPAAFLGAVDDPVPVLHAADVLVLPSRSEQQPAVVIEAALCGLPVVATAVGGLPDLVDDGVTGILVPPGDRAVLGAWIAELLEDPARRQAMGVAGRAAALERFTFEATADRWIEVFEAVASSPRRNGGGRR